MEQRIKDLAEMVTAAGHDYHIHDVNDDDDDRFFLLIRDPDNPAAVTETKSIWLHESGTAAELFDRLLAG